MGESRRSSLDLLTHSTTEANTHLNLLREEYTKKSDELLDYVAFLESNLERMKADAASDRCRYDQEKRQVRNQIDVAVAKVREAQRHIKTHLASRQDAERKLQDAHRQLQQEECRYAYLQSETSDQNKMASLLKLVRKLQRELERENLSLTHGGDNSTSVVGCHYIETEMRRLLALCDTPVLENQPEESTVPVVLPQLSTPRSLKQDEYLTAQIARARKTKQQECSKGV